MSEIEKCIVWDLGATKCASAVVAYDAPSNSFNCLKTTKVDLAACDSLNHLTDTLQHQLDEDFSAAQKVFVAGAGIYDGQVLQLTNGYPYEMNFGALGQQRRWSDLRVVHDYVPNVCATFIADFDDASQVQFLHRGNFDPYGRRVVFGLGTGLGLKDGVLLPNGKCWLGQNEVGHIGIPFPPLGSAQETQLHEQFMHFLRSKACLAPNQTLTFEKILSGKGMARMHQFITAAKNHLLPDEVGVLLRSGTAQETLSMFAWYLGLFIGTMQLLYMPSGGIWMTGGVLQKHPEALTHPQLQKGIVASPAYLAEREQFPLARIISEDLIFLGGAYYAVHG